MSFLDIIPIAFVLIALFGVLNHHTLKLPSTIGVLVIALAVSLMILGLDGVMPDLHISALARSVLVEIDFNEALMKGMLSFLLFAGALHVDMEELKKRKAAIAIMASLGVLLSTFVVGYGFHYMTGMSLIAALVFGALISPTDPVAVMGILKTVKVPKSLETKIAGESLFNDGIGVVIFAVLAAIAFPSDGVYMDLSLGGVIVFLLQEALGGAVLGGVAGYVAYRLLKSIDEYVLEIIITLALVTGAYALAAHLHTSGPIAVVVAGLFIGNHGKDFAMSDKTSKHLTDFWHLLDEILNAMLFTLIGFEVLVVDVGMAGIWAGVVAIPIVLGARFAAVALPITTLSMKKTFTKGAIPVLTWGGLRGGISVALALSLPPSPERDLIVTATYVVVIFSIVVQGLSVSKVIARTVKGG